MSKADEWKLKMNHDVVGRGWGWPLQTNDRGGIALVGGFDEIDQAIQIILSTAIGERVMRPEFGSRLHELAYVPVSEDTKALARRYVEDALTRWEPRIRVAAIDVSDGHDIRLLPTSVGTLFVRISYRIKATGDQRSLVYPFYLIPGE